MLISAETIAVNVKVCDCSFSPGVKKSARMTLKVGFFTEIVCTGSGEGSRTASSASFPGPGAPRVFGLLFSVMEDLSKVPAISVDLL